MPARPRPLTDCRVGRGGAGWSGPALASAQTSAALMDDTDHLTDAIPETNTICGPRSAQHFVSFPTYL